MNSRLLASRLGDFQRLTGSSRSISADDSPPDVIPHGQAPDVIPDAQAPDANWAPGGIPRGSAVAWVADGFA